MEICWGNLEGVRLTNSGMFVKYKDRKRFCVLKYFESCKNCGEPFLAPAYNKKSQFCSHKCQITGLHNPLVCPETKARHKKSAENTKLFGENHPNWKGGIHKEHNGYIGVYNGRNKRASTEHRKIAEIVMGRCLKTNEVVHHINGVKNDNRKCNLLVCDAAYHHWLERKMSNLYKKEHFGAI
jgi:hypothetical protein